MLPSMMGLQIPSLLSGKKIKTQQNRDFAAQSCDPTMFSKPFKNLDCFNEFDKYQSQARLVKSLNRSVLKNSCQRPHIINSIKEKCPEVIPSTVEEVAQQEPITITHLGQNMWHLDTAEMHQSKGLKRKFKLSGQDTKQQDITERMQAEKPQGISNELGNISFSPKIRSLTLKDVMSQKPIPTPHIDISLRKKSLEMLVTIKSSSPLPRSRKYSITDSEDSFIVLDETEDHKADNGGFDGSTSPHLPKAPSFCESEDSFIVFEQGEEDNDVSFDGNSSIDSESSWGTDSEAQSIGDYDEVDFCKGADTSKKVKFATEDKLCEIHPMIKWSYAYQAARQGPWEMYARDRGRFRDRALRVERDIKYVFDPQHRERVYRQRFENLN